MSAEVEAGSADDATAVINYAGGRFAFRRNRELQCGGILFELELFSLCAHEGYKLSLPVFVGRCNCGPPRHRAGSLRCF